MKLEKYNISKLGFAIYIFITVFCAIFINNNVLAQSQATINVKFTHNPADTIKLTSNGGFIELLEDHTNGFLGMWAQELKDRGVDFKDGQFLGLWRKDLTMPKYDSVNICKGGYNENGEYYVSMKSTTGRFIGISQSLYLSDTCAHNLYFYAQSLPGTKQQSKVIFKFIENSTAKVLYSDSISIFGNEWKKYETSIPITQGLRNCVFFIGTNDSVNLDELSLMPANNVFGMRSEYAKYFDYWRPKVMRYPGGWFADSKFAKWKNCLLPIDKRSSPCMAGYQYSERSDMAFGEFMNICNFYKISPQIVVNFENGTPEEAAEWVEYANGDTNTVNGKLRAAQGFTKPFNIKYWEVGNEQWKQPEQYATRYIEYYDKMKLVDSAIMITIDGDLWNSDSFDKLMNIVGAKCDIWGIHPSKGLSPTWPGTDREKYLWMVCNETYEKKVKDYSDKIAFSKNPKMLQAFTEWWSQYRRDDDFILCDTNSRNKSLEAALWNVINTMLCYKNPNLIEFASHNIGVGVFGKEVNKFNNKVFFAYPTLYGFAMLGNHLGNILCASEVACDSHNNKSLDIWINDTKYLECMTTANKDTIYIAVVNRHPDDEMLTTITLPNGANSVEACKAYELSSNSYIDYNSVDNTENIMPKEKTFNFTGAYAFPKHSFTILAIPTLESGVAYEDKDVFTIYPNPFKNELIILNKNTSLLVESIKIFNNLGVAVQENSIQNASTTININTEFLLSGVYYVEIKTSDSKYYYKVVKY